MKTLIVSNMFSKIWVLKVKSLKDVQMINLEQINTNIMNQIDNYYQQDCNQLVLLQ